MVAVVSKMLTREEAETNENYGYYPHERPIEELLKYGVIFLDKIKGPTSHQMVAWVKEILGIKKAGQTGTLDPHATGMLEILLGRAVKLTSLVARQDKEYVGIMHLHKDVEVSKILETFYDFRGEIIQRPPLRSAVSRKPRKRKIYFLRFLEKEDRYVLFHVRCEAGTYIRTLCVDIGKAMGINAHLQELRRIAIGEFREDRCCIIQDLRDAYEIYLEKKEDKYLREIILPCEILLKNVKKILIKDTAVNAICYGAQLHVGGVSKLDEGIKKGDTVAILTLKGEIVAYGKSLMSSEEILRKRKGECVKIERVIMERDLYPSAWKISKK